MTQAAGVAYSLPWSPDVVPAADYRAPENYIEDTEDEDEEDLMNDNSGLLLMQAYTIVILNPVYV